MCKTDNAIQRIQNYVESYCSVLDIPCGTDLFKKRSYRRWAAYEICDLIASHPFDNVDAIIEDFMFLIMAYMSFDHARTELSLVTVISIIVNIVQGKIRMIQLSASVPMISTS